MEPDLTQTLVRPLGGDLTPGKATARVVEDASAELGGVDPADPPMDEAPDIMPDSLEERSPVPEGSVTARPTSGSKSVPEE